MIAIKQKQIKRRIKQMKLKSLNPTQIVEKMIDFISSEKKFFQSKTSENILKILFMSSSFIYSLPMSFSARLISLPIDFLIATTLSCYYVIHIARERNINIKEEKKKIASFIVEKVIPYILKNLSWKVPLRRRSIAFSFTELIQRSKIMEEIERLFQSHYYKENKNGK